ncbi:MAG: nitrate ABC transporter substrate-binding protein, partial [Herminiimonas sp.]|nr:nitrate ABC transporter substrate-binding protein [Herminiimonas sp.]
MTRKDLTVNTVRRTALKGGAALTAGACGALATRGVWAAGSDKPE